MASSTLQKSAYIQSARSAMTQLYNAAALCRRVADEGADMGVLSGAGVLVDGDFINEAAGLLAADFIAALGVANNAVRAADRLAIAKSKL